MNNLHFQSDAPLVALWRGDVLESLHRGHVAVADSSGAVLASHGSPHQRVTLRSCAKPLQAIALVEGGAADAFDLTDSDLALCCASHQGEEFHVEAARALLRKAGLNQGALRCGAHWPLGPKAAARLRQVQDCPDPLHNNCSGKHAGMLLTAIHMREGTADYEHPDHPVQRRIRAVIQDWTGCPNEELIAAQDGCAVPTYAMPLWRFALAFARLAETDGPGSGGVSNRIVTAMLAHPDMVGGTERNLDTEVMKACGSTILSKVGAEGVACAAILPAATGRKRAVGIAVKITDGDSRGIRSVALLSALEQWGALTPDAMQHLARFGARPLRNCRGDEVGRIESVLRLQ